MISNQEDDEFIAVRVQDPRIQNEGSWNSYVDYKIFLHTNSKAFTAKTSCVRRRYSEFAWLKKKLQKNSGLIPVPGLPRKSFFSFSNEDFLEGRRKGLQAFLDKVVHMTVCLSDSQLHLFLQTQLPVGHILDCVQGHTPYSVMDAILTYASSNQGLAQAQEEDTIKEPSLTVSYESMESPVPHQPGPLTKETVSPEPMSCHESEPQEGFLQRYESDTVELEGKESSLLRVLQGNNKPEAVIEDRVATEVSFFVGDSHDESGSLSLAEETQPRSCQIQAPVEVHSPMAAASEMNCGVVSTFEGVCSLREEIISTTDMKGNTVAHPDREEEEAHQQDCPEEAYRENNCEIEECVDSVVVLNLKDGNTQSQEDVLEDICSEKNILENNIISDVDGLEHVVGTVGHIADGSCPDEILNSEKEPDNSKSSEPEIKEDTPLESEIQEDIHSLLQVETGDNDMGQQMDIKQVALEPDMLATKDESDEEPCSLPSSNESIVKVSDEESICEETKDLILAENDNMKTSCEEVTLWSEVETSSRSILDLHMNGSPEEGDSISNHEDVSLEEDMQYMTKIDYFCKSMDLNSAVAAGDLTEHSEFRILESNSLPGLGESKCTDNESPPLLDITDES